MEEQWHPLCLQSPLQVCFLLFFSFEQQDFFSFCSGLSLLAQQDFDSVLLSAEAQFDPHAKLLLLAKSNKPKMTMYLLNFIFSVSKLRNIQLNFKSVKSSGIQEWSLKNRKQNNALFLTQHQKSAQKHHRYRT